MKTKQKNGGYIDGVNIIFALIFLVLSFGVIFLIKDSHDDSVLGKNGISDLGYSVDDVEIFLKGTPFDRRDFCSSPGLRKQYEEFRDGKETEFMRTARANESKKEAQETAFATGLLIGTASGAPVK